MRNLAFWTLPSCWKVVIIWFLSAADSAIEGEDVGVLEEFEDDEEEELNGLGIDGKDIFV
jgi:hypothetical protein